VNNSCFITSPTGAVTKYCDEYFCLCISLSVREDISRTIRSVFTQFLCMLLMFVASSSSYVFTIGRIAYRWEGVFFPIENALSAGKGGRECTAEARFAIYDCRIVLVIVLYFVPLSFFYEQQKFFACFRKLSTANVNMAVFTFMLGFRSFQFNGASGFV